MDHASVEHAIELQNAFVESIHGEAPDFDLIHEAIHTLESAMDSEDASVGIWLAEAQMCCGAAERRRGNAEIATACYEDAEAVLTSATFATDSDEQLDLHWNKTRGALYMNWGVLERLQGSSGKALELGLKAEWHLFHQYLLKVEPPRDVEATASTINLWQNIMEAALDVDEGGRAAESAFNGLKLLMYWNAHDLETPAQVEAATGDLLCCIHGLSPARRGLLDAHLPAEVAEMFNAMG